MSKYTAALTPEKYLSPPEEGQFMALLDKNRDKDLRNTTMFMIMLKTGTRPSETVALRWRDINWQDKSLFIKTQKGGPDRVIPLNTNLIYRLNKMKPGKPDEKIFKITYWSLFKIWERYRPVKKKPHCLRHTFAVNFYKNSRYNLFLTQLALGHNNLASTSVYLQIHCDLDDFRKAIGD